MIEERCENCGHMIPVESMRIGSDGSTREIHELGLCQKETRTKVYEGLNWDEIEASVRINKRAGRY